MVLGRAIPRLPRGQGFSRASGKPSRSWKQPHTKAHAGKFDRQLCRRCRLSCEHSAHTAGGFGLGHSLGGFVEQNLTYGYTDLARSFKPLTDRVTTLKSQRSLPNRVGQKGIGVPWPDMTGHRKRPRAQRPDLLGHQLTCLDTSARHYDIGAGPSDRERHLPAQSLTAASNGDDTSRQVKQFCSAGHADQRNERAFTYQSGDRPVESHHHRGHR
jgi:hypothetical protein